MGKTLRGPIQRRLMPHLPSPAPSSSSTPGFVLEAYTLANGYFARRYWALPGRILIGGQIVSQEDAQSLRAKYGVTHVLSAESEKNDDATWMDPTTHGYFPFPDDGRPIPPDLCQKAIVFARSVLAIPGAVLYCHCHLGGSRGPTMAYMTLRLLGRSREEAYEQCGRRKLYTTDIHAAYLNSIESALTSAEERP
jgi:hypothetical protein